jgi:MFS family permease
MHSESPSASATPGPAIWILLASLYCAQGLPSGLIAHALPVLLRQQGGDLAVIGLLKLVALPWLLKALWAPWVDRIGSSRFGHSRSWILPLQALLIVAVMVLALIEPGRWSGPALPLLLGTLLLINLAAATQDIATDGLTVRLLPERWRGLGNSLQVGGYKIGMIISGSGLLLFVDTWGWSASVAAIALLLVLVTLPIWRFDELSRAPRIATATESARSPRLLLDHYRGLFAQPGMGLWIAVVLSFKIGDSLGSPMIKPLLVDAGWSSAQIGQLTLASSLAGIGGAILGGALLTRLGLRTSLLLFGALQATGIAAFALIAAGHTSADTVYAIALGEQIADGMSTVALFAAMMHWCRPGHEGADYTVQASAQVLLASLLGAFSGVLAKAGGYGAVFAGAGLAGAAALLLVALHFAREARAGR